MALKWLAASATQGSADAFVEAEFSTGLSNVTRSAFRIRRIEWLLPSPIGADSFIQAQLARSTQTSIIGTLPNSIIANRVRVMELTTSGMALIETTVGENYARDMEFLIVEESLFLRLDSNGTSAANTVSVRIGYEVRTITENERLSIQALTA